MNREILVRIGANIARIRKKKKLTLREVSDLTDIEISNLIPIEKGRRNVTVLTLDKIAGALGVEIKDFL
jgi:transcriptional regulator with XRE-family HTH domain